MTRPSDPRVGLCAGCRHARLQRTTRGSSFWRCLKADNDPGFARYPALPVLACPGFDPLTPVVAPRKDGPAMRVVVDQELCEGNAECMKIAPEVFAVGDDDRAHLLVERPAEALRAKVEAAVRRCPRQALSLRDD